MKQTLEKQVHVQNVSKKINYKVRKISNFVKNIKFIVELYETDHDVNKKINYVKKT